VAAACVTGADGVVWLEEGGAAAGVGAGGGGCGGCGDGPDWGGGTRGNVAGLALLLGRDALLLLRPVLARWLRGGAEPGGDVRGCGAAPPLRCGGGSLPGGSMRACFTGRRLEGRLPRSLAAEDGLRLALRPLASSPSPAASCCCCCCCCCGSLPGYDSSTRWQGAGGAQRAPEHAAHAVSAVNLAGLVGSPHPLLTEGVWK